MKTAFFLSALLGFVLLSAPAFAFPANSANPAPVSEVVAVEYEIEGLAFGDWIKAIEDKIDQAITAAKEIGAIVVDKLEEIGQEALEKLITATGNLEEALDKFVQEILPKLIAKAKSGLEGLEPVADVIVAVLKNLGAKGLEIAAKWIAEHQDEVGKMLADLILSKIREIITGGFDVAEYSLTEKAVDYLKEKLKELMKLAYEEAVQMVDTIIYYLKTYGVPALKAALEFVKEMQCDLGEMIYKLLHNKLNAALGIEDEMYAIMVVQPLGFKDWLEAAGNKIVEIIEAGKEMGSDIGDLFKDMGKAIADMIKESSGMVEDAANSFVEKVLPKVLKAIKTSVEKGGEGVEKIVVGVVATLKRLGSSALQKAIDWLEPRRGEVDAIIHGKLLSELKKALEEMTKGQAAYSIGSCSAAETLAFKDWLESVGDKIADIIQSGKELGKDALDSIKDLGSKAIAKIVEASASVKEATITFLKTVVPKMLAAAKTAIEKGGAGAEKVVSTIVSSIKSMGASAIQTAIDWLESGNGDLDDSITGKLLSELKEALKDLGKETVLDINSFAAMEVLGFKDWLEVIGDKIAEIIESGKEIGKDAADAIKDLGHEAIAKIIEASANIQVAADQFLNEVLPKILEKVKGIAAEGQEAAEKVADAIVGILKKLGAKGLQMAIEWLEKNKDEIGQKIYDMIIAKIKDALAEIGLTNAKEFHAFDVAQPLSLKDILEGLGESLEGLKDMIKWLPTLSFKEFLEWVEANIVAIAKIAKQMGKDLPEVIRDLAQAALDKLIKASIDIQAAKKKFVEEVLPKILEKTKEIAGKGTEEAAKIIEAIVGILKKLGASGLRLALEWLEDNKDQINESIFKIIVAKIEAALKEIGLKSALDSTSYEIQSALAFKDWLEKIGDKISGAIEAGKDVGKQIGEAIKEVGQDALDKLVEISGDIAAAKERFVEEVLPKIMAKLSEIAAKGEEKANQVIDAVVSVLKKLGAKGLTMAIEWLEKNKDSIAKGIFDKIVAKIEQALEEIGLGGVTYGMMETAEEYVKDALMKAAYAGYDAAVYIFDKMIEFLKMFGIGALRLAEKLVEANKCLVGAYVYGMAMGKVKAAIKMAAIGGIVG